METIHYGAASPRRPTDDDAVGHLDLSLTSSHIVLPDSSIDLTAQGSAPTLEFQVDDAPVRHACPTCNKTFPKSSDLKRHQKCHLGQRPFPCRTCSKCFLKASDLKRHDRIHSGEKPYVCQVCGRCFAEGGSLQRHSRMHTGERPYSCSICNKQFVRSYNAKKHTKVHGTTDPASVIVTKLPKASRRQPAAQVVVAQQSAQAQQPHLITTASVVAPTRLPGAMNGMQAIQALTISTAAPHQSRGSPGDNSSNSSSSGGGRGADDVVETRHVLSAARAACLSAGSSVLDSIMHP